MEKKMNESPQAMNELAMQNVIRKRYCQNWPDTILQLTKRVQAVNQTWTQIVVKLMTIPGLSITWKHNTKSGVLEVSIAIKHPASDGIPLEEVEIIEISAEELHKAHQYIEVLLMDKVDHSELIARWLEDEQKAESE